MFRQLILGSFSKENANGGTEMKIVYVVAAFFMGSTIAVSAQADPLNPEEKQYLLCKDVSVKSWGNQLDIEQIVKNLGYTPFNSRIEKGCWEVKAYDTHNEIYEFYIHPVSQEIVLRKHKPK